MGIGYYAQLAATGWLPETLAYRDWVLSTGEQRRLTVGMQPVNEWYAQNLPRWSTLKLLVGAKYGRRNDLGVGAADTPALYSLDAQRRVADATLGGHFPRLEGDFLYYEGGAAEFNAPAPFTRLSAAFVCTLAVWYKFTERPTGVFQNEALGGLMGQDYLGGFAFGYGLYVKDDGLTIQARINNAVSEGNDPTNRRDGNWHRAVAVFDFPNSRMILYADGVETKRVALAFSGAPAADMGTMKIACSGAGNFNFRGHIYTSECWAHAWSAAEVAADFNIKPN